MKKLWRFVAEISCIAILVVDLFCGAGGTTTGMEQAEILGKKVARVIVCVNHDKNAIRSHEANHPETIHMTEDIRVQAMEPIAKIVRYWKALCPWAKLVLWASLECTNHSNAKGGDSRDADSRSLAEHLDRYIIGLNPDYVWIENVREFRKWGPLLHKRHKKTGRKLYHINKQTGERVPTMVPDKTKWAIYFERWKTETQALGYIYDDRDFNAANFNAHQNRVRYFGSFARVGLNHIFPKPFTKKGRPVREVLDFSDEGQSIFDPNRKKKIDSPKTFDRVRSGVEKHAAPGRENFVVKYTNYSNEVVNPGIDMDSVCPTVCARPHLAFASVKYHQAADVSNTDFLALYYSGGGQTSGMDSPSPAVVTKDRVQKCKVFFIDNTYGQSLPTSIEQTCGALSTNPHHYLVSASWLDNRYGSGPHNHSSVERPSGSILNVPKQVLMNARFILNHNFSNTPTSVDAPAPAILASRKHHYIISPQFNNPPTSVEQESPAVIARQDKKPLSLLTYDAPKVLRIIIQETENPAALPVEVLPIGTVIYNLPGEKLLNSGTIKKRKYYAAKRALIEVMAKYGIIDIKMRMLKVVELLRIQGFPENYTLIGTQSEQKKYIGNAVYTGIAKAWAEEAAADAMPWLSIAA